jgi:hypothetical protein
MRGSDGRSGALFSYADLEDRVPGGHPERCQAAELWAEHVRRLAGAATTVPIGARGAA